MTTTAGADRDWWRSAVTYQIYPRSFADGNGDGTGDLTGVLARLDHLSSLGVDAIWFSPWYPSPLADGGYDVSDYRSIHPDFGTDAQADEVIAAIHDRGMRVLIDLVPNHCSDAHPWFTAAVAAGPGSPERARFVFRDGRGPNGDEPPTNWRSVFGGSAWQRVTAPDGTPEQWYLHLFAPEQPDFDWTHPEVHAEFVSILRHWFDRGIDGFRIDVADSMVKDQAFGDMPVDPATGLAVLEKYEGSPVFDRSEVHDILREWRRVADSYADHDAAGPGSGPRVFVSEAWLTPAERLARYVRRDELHMTFNFDALSCAWDATSLRAVIDSTRAALGAVGAPSTWVLANHDTTRVATRYGKPVTGRVHRPADQDGEADTAAQMMALSSSLHLVPTDHALGVRRARAAALLMLALPGGAYIYQGDELGLPEVEDLPESVLQDPTWERSGHTVRGRDGCRVPIPWTRRNAEASWLPLPADWGEHSVEAQDGDPGSTLTLYRDALAERHRQPALGDGDMTWDDAPAGVLSFTREPGFRCVVNLSEQPVDLPDGDVLLASGPIEDRTLGTDQAAWLRT